MTLFNTKIFRAVTALIGAGFILSGCIQNAPASSCSNEAACALAAQAAAELQPEVGKDLGGGVVIRAVRAQGEVMVQDIDLPLSGASMDEATRASFGQTVAAATAEGFCRDPQLQVFFDVGASLRVRTYGTEGEQLSDNTITSCT